MIRARAFRDFDSQVFSVQGEGAVKTGNKSRLTTREMVVLVVTVLVVTSVILRCCLGYLAMIRGLSIGELAMILISLLLAIVADFIGVLVYAGLGWVKAEVTR